ncbi:Phosphatidylinositol 3-kinase tor2 [Sphaceloma murrayae]|uniref:Phosphatidylinositol 3-kinase tor2 n=1 Tax=Sphaceloma murrayae TaxID=2082308 RepID=A0A2K1QSF9_9PEZI|nr:Phosphatidylinositol 3-kinase tor2 [Sphaceloma murrayae]
MAPEKQLRAAVKFCKAARAGEAELAAEGFPRCTCTFTSACDSLSEQTVTTFSTSGFASRYAMSVREASNRSNALVDTLRTTFQQIGKLSKEPDQELAQDIHESLKQHEEALELLQQDVEDLAGPSDRPARRETERSRESARLAAQVHRIAEDLKHARSQFRRAQLSAKRAIENQKAAEREAQLSALKKAYATSDKPVSSTDLFAGRRTTAKQLTEDELLLNTSSDITAALRQTHQQLTSELGRSRFAQETLAQSSAALNDLGDRYSNLDNLLVNSRNLLGTLVKSQKSDTWYLETAFYILCATLGWLIFRRLIYGPAWWFIWLPLRYVLLQPFIFLLRAFGGSSQGVAGLKSSSLSRPPLRIKPSASGGPPKMPEGVRRMGMPVGGGGSGAKMGTDGQPVQQEGLAEQIGRMAEESRQQEQGQGQEDVHGQEAKSRGDGTKLEPRGEVPKNPKKKTFDVDVEDAKQDELRKRDEL